MTTCHSHILLHYWTAGLELVRLLLGKIKWNKQDNWAWTSCLADSNKAYSYIWMIELMNWRVKIQREGLREHFLHSLTKNKSTLTKDVTKYLLLHIYIETQLLGCEPLNRVTCNIQHRKCPKVAFGNFAIQERQASLSPDSDEITVWLSINT